MISFTAWKRPVAVALAGLFLFGSLPAANAAPIQLAPIAPPSSLPGARADIVQVREVIIRRKGGQAARDRGYSKQRAYGGNRDVYRNRNAYRQRDFNRRYSNDRRYRNDRYYNNNRRWVYDQRRYGPRYGYRRSGYNYYRDGYWYSNPWWGVGAGVAAGALVGAAVANSAQPVYDDHVSYCLNRYRSYDARTDTFMGSDGVRRRCVGP